MNNGKLRRVQKHTSCNKRPLVCEVKNESKGVVHYTSIYGNKIMNFYFDFFF